MTARTVSARALAAALGRFPPTAEQTAVLESPLEPALVVAGAGSGKTETMAGRVVWLVANGLVRRDQVLGLTFTRKAAGELAERVRRRLARLGEFERAGLVPHLDRLHAEGALAPFAGLEGTRDADAARRTLVGRLAASVDAVPRADAVDDTLLERPAVLTYNSFADGVVREHAVRIGRDPEAVLLTESAAWLLMRRVVFDSDDPRLETREEAVRTIVDGALRLARDAVDNLVDLDDLAAFPGRFARIEELPSTKRNVDVYADVRRAVVAVGGLGPLVDLAREYGERKRRRGLLDFSDQVAGALAAVRAHSAVAAELRDRYRVVLLDEYQDTSVVQTDLLAAAFRGAPVMAVGDPHQAIYGWRGASAGNLAGFAAAFGGDARYTLLTSWRNCGRVLDAANAVLAPLGTGAGAFVEALRPRPDAPAGAVEVAFDTDLDVEAKRVATWFEQVRDARGDAGEATSGAVLFRSKKHMVRFGEALGARGIPHRILGLGGLLATPEVVDIVSALRVIADPAAGSALLRLLAGPRWAIGLPDLRALADLARRLARSDAALQPLDPVVAERIRASAGEDHPSLVDALDFVARQSADHGWLAGFTPLARERLREAGAVLGQLRRAVGVPIPDLVRLVELELRLDVELAAHETRGPARIASAQLRAFVDELQGFLAADETGSLSNLLAWLDRAELLDEFQPRTEPPEEGVVQLLTIHGAKGLEWDAVAVVRMVEGELPTRVRDAKGWLRFGMLPYAFRGDAPWLPELAWRSAATQQDLRVAFDAFDAGVRARQLEEERRLAYVAITRARDHLLLTGSSWSGTKSPRAPSPFLVEAAHVLGIPAPDPDPGADPPETDRRVLEWPLDALGARRPRVEQAAALAEAARAGRRDDPDDELALLLAERAERERPPREQAPVRIPASRWKDFVADYDGAVRRQRRPLPERPHRRTRLGTLFHAWVEHRSGRIGTAPSLDDALWDDAGDDMAAPGADASDTAELRRLQQAFEASEWADLAPLEVETEIDMVATDLDGRPHLVICKLDAVYRRGGRIEIVDWKTGAPPTTAAERAERMLQVELYRRAYHARHGVPLEDIDVALFYVGAGVVLRG